MRRRSAALTFVLAGLLGLFPVIQPVSAYATYQQTLADTYGTTVLDALAEDAGQSGAGEADSADGEATDAEADGEAQEGADAAATEEPAEGGGTLQEPEEGSDAEPVLPDATQGDATSDASNAVEPEAVEPEAEAVAEPVTSDDAAPKKPELSVEAYVQDLDWQKAVSDGEIAGTTGESKHLEALKITLKDADTHTALDENALEVQAHVQDYGWMPEDGSWIHNGEMAGTTGENKQLEAVRIRLSDELSSYYDVWYRAHVANFGWLDWACNGAEAGSAGYGYAVEAVEITILPKGSEDAPTETEQPFRDHKNDPAVINYQAHVAEIGWRGSVADGAQAGTTGRNLSMEALRTSLSWYGHSGGVEVRAHVADIGWQGWKTGEAGTTGKGKQMEAVQIRLTGEAATTYDVWYQVHSAEVGWLGWAKNGEVAGTTGKGYGIQAIRIKLLPAGSDAPGNTNNSYIGSFETLQGTAVTVGGASVASANKETTTIGKAQASNVLQSFSLTVNNKITEGSVRYRALLGYAADWQGSWASDGAQVNGGNNGQPVKAVQMQLAGNLAEKYDLWYQVYDSQRGWMGWASNGASAGVQGGASAVCAIQVKLVVKGAAAPGSTSNAFVSGEVSTPQLVIQAHSADVGWQAPVADGAVGTTGQGRSLQALRVGLEGPVSGSVKVNAHVTNIGWQGDKAEGNLIGTTGKNLSIQAIQVKLDGDIAASYDVYYRVHSATYGWLGWAKNGQTAGTTGLNLQAEAVEIRLAKKGANAPASDAPASIELPTLSVQTHVQDIGWQNAVGSGGTAGTTGRALKIEALKLSVGSSSVSGGISYSAHVQDIGWQPEVSNGAVAGTTGQNKRVEAVKIRLTGDLSKYFDVWYRAYVQDYGWLGWAKNGAQAGTGSIGYRMEALQVKIVAKGAAAPGSTSGAYTNKPMMPADQLAMLSRANNYSSSTGWLLMADTTNCKVGVYRGSRGHWQQVYFWDCTPGAYATPTVIGEFTVTGKGYVFGHGYSCYYYTQFYGDYLFHSIKYYQGTFNVMDGRLGVHASLGCVRLALQNAKWIYDNIPYGTKVVTYR